MGVYKRSRKRAIVCINNSDCVDIILNIRKYT